MKLLEAKLKTGAYASPDDVVRAAFQALNESEVYAAPGLDNDTLDGHRALKGIGRTPFT